MPLLWFSCDNSAIFAPWEMIRLIQLSGTLARPLSTKL
jgi:hypothetical protein